ncbi:integrase family protein [Janibacter hoylei PVAS-1]|uniref:Integrase family protein n=1 Tax=Janibacter hoylei PVAS-1 TaxID=1210046 RepID=K1DZ87_9MICO|nr:integrase family protein [Janibacter hoylei PVAS-1]
MVGEHGIPGVLPDAIRADRGSIFTGTHFRALCRQFGINLLLSRGAHPTDNAVMERFWETLQACFQAAPGYKGHNVSERGSKVGRITLDKAGQPVFHGGAPALTPRELERHIREWIATTYHRSPHSSLVLADKSITAEDARMRLTPLDVYDSLMAAQGRIHVLQRADLIYDAMPIRWGQIGANGVEFDDLYYDCRELDEFRNVRDWTFRSPDQTGHTGDQRARAGAKAAPFYYDPRDVSAYWLRHPDTDRIIRVPWRREHELRAPMTGLTLRHAKGLMKKRGAYRDLSRDSIEEEVLTTLNTADGYDRLRGGPGPGGLARQHAHRRRHALGPVQARPRRGRLRRRRPHPIDRRGAAPAVAPPHRRRRRPGRPGRPTPPTGRTWRSKNEGRPASLPGLHSADRATADDHHLRGPRHVRPATRPRERGAPLPGGPLLRLRPRPRHPAAPDCPDRGQRAVADRDQGRGNRDRRQRSGQVHDALPSRLRGAPTPGRPAHQPGCPSRDHRPHHHRTQSREPRGRPRARPLPVPGGRHDGGEVQRADRPGLGLPARCRETRALPRPPRTTRCPPADRRRPAPAENLTETGPRGAGPPQSRGHRCRRARGYRHPRRRESAHTSGHGRPAGDRAGLRDPRRALFGHHEGRQAGLPTVPA